MNRIGKEMLKFIVGFAVIIGIVRATLATFFGVDLDFLQFFDSLVAGIVAGAIAGIIVYKITTNQGASLPPNQTLKVECKSKQTEKHQKGSIKNLEIEDLLVKTAHELTDEELLTLISLGTESNLDVSLYCYEFDRRQKEKQTFWLKIQGGSSIAQAFLALGLIAATVGLFIATQNLTTATEDTVYLHPKLEIILERDFTKEGHLIVSASKNVVDGQIGVYNTGQIPLILQPLAREPTYEIYLNCLGEKPIRGIFSAVKGAEKVGAVEGPLLKSGEFEILYFSIDKQDLDVTNDCNVNGKITTSRPEVAANFTFGIELSN